MTWKPSPTRPATWTLDLGSALGDLTIEALGDAGRWRAIWWKVNDGVLFEEWALATADEAKRAAVEWIKRAAALDGKVTP